MIKSLQENRPSCPLRAELSTGRVVHGPSCPATVVVHTLSKDISYVSKLNESTNESFLGKIFKFRGKMFKFHKNALRFLSAV